jgi:tetratricopeptide (TPR) repeat protein
MRRPILIVLSALILRAADLETARTRLQESQAALERGDYARAIETASTAESLYRQAGEAREEGKAANNVGQAQLFRGEYTAALASFRRALAIDQRIGEAEAEITVENNIGTIYFFQGRYLEALEAYESALTRTGQTLDQAWNQRRRQMTLVNLGVLYEQLGQNSKALDYYQQANLSPTALPPREQAQLLSNLGTLYRRMGSPARALEAYREARKQYPAGDRSGGQVNVLHNLGILLLLDYRDPRRALDAFAEALRLAWESGNKRQATLANLFRGEALFRIGDLDAARAEFAAALAGAREFKGLEEQWTALFGLGRIDQRRGSPKLALDEYREAIRTIESVRAGLGRASLKTDFLANKREVYDASIGLLLDTSKPDAGVLFDLIEQARARNLQDALLRRLARPTLRAVQARLGPGTLLVEYWLGRERGAAVWLTRAAAGVAPFEVTAGSAAAVERLPRELEAGGDWRPASRALGSLLLSRERLNGMERVMVVPDGALQRLPFETLETGGRLLVERAPVSYLPTAAMLLTGPRERALSGPWETQLAAFGDPSVGRGPGVFEPDLRWTPLPHARRELESVARALPGAAATFAGPANLKSNLTAPEVREAAVLHFSTHAAVDLRDASRSRMLFTAAAGQPGSEYLFFREAQNLDLRHAELVTVSACDTEGGQMVRGEGVQSFSRAFLTAGAASTVTTLWRVADQPTAEFMKQFYYRLGKGESKAGALREAKLAFLRSGNELAHPRYWAAFVLSGDGASPLPPVVRWWWLGAGAAGLAAVAVGLRRGRRG